jgi:hypothetical protein
VIRGAAAIAGQALAFAWRVGEFARPAVVKQGRRVVSRGPDGRPLAVIGFTVTRGRIVEIDVLVTPLPPPPGST